MEGFDYKQDVVGSVDFASTGDKAIWTPSQPVDVVRWGIITDALLDVGAGFTLKVDWRPTAGSDSSRTDGVPTSTTSPGNYTTPLNMTTTVDIAAGTEAFISLPEPLQVNPGEQLVFQVTDAADTNGTGLVWVQYQPRPFVAAAAGRTGDRMSAVVDLTP